MQTRLNQTFCALLLLCWLGLAESAHAVITFRGANSAGAQDGGVPVYVSSATANSWGGNQVTSLTINRPANTLTNHVLVAQVTLSTVLTSGEITPPTGWSLVDFTTRNSISQAVYIRVVAAGEPASYTWNWTASARAAGGIMAFRNIDVVSPVDVSGAATAASKTINIPGITTSVANTMLAAQLASSAANNNHSAASGMVERYEVSTTAGSQGVTVSGDTQLQASAGAVAAKTASSSSSVDNIGHIVALRPSYGALTIAVPDSTALNDVMVATIVVRAKTIVINAPAGWTQLQTNQSSNSDAASVRMTTYYRVAGASEPASYTWTFSSGTHAGAAGGIASFSGVDTSDPIDAYGGNGTSSAYNHQAGGITTTASNVMLVTAHAFASTTSNWTPPGGMTEALDEGSMLRPDNTGVSIEMNYQQLAAAGATGSRSASANSAGTDAGYGAAHILALRPGTGLHHVRLVHDGAGVTCAKETISLQACGNADCSLLDGGSTTVTLSGSGWSGNPVTFTGSTSVDLSITSPQTVTLDVAAVSPVPSNGMDCFDGSTANNTTACQLPFADTGFIFSSIPSQVAGVTSSDITLQAVRKSDSSAACVGVFTGNVAIDMASQCVNPTTCAGKQITINSTAITNNPASGISGYESVTLNFGADSTATFTLSYPDVGMMNLHARKLLAGTDYITGSSNAFVVKPHHFDLSGIKQSAAPNTANPAATDAAGAKFVKAGEAFSVTVTAMTEGGAATPNYGREIAPEGVKLSSTLVSGLGLTKNPAISNNSDFGSFTDGVATGTKFGWEEVGIITLTPSVADGDYLGAGDVSGTTSGNVGRFYPNNFAMTGASLTNRSDLPACAAPGFSYMDEPFKVDFTLTAQGASGASLENYAGSFAKLGLAAPASFGFGALNGGSNLTPRLDLALPSSGTWGTPLAGSAAVAATLAVKRAAAPDGPFAALSIGIAPVDSDGVALLPGALDLDVDGAGGDDHAKLEQTELRFGRLRVYNAHGSEQLALPVPFKAQYFNGVGFVNNMADSCTQVPVPTVANGGLVFPVSGQALVAGDTVASVNGAASGNGIFNSGDGGMLLSRPSGGHSGYVTLTIAAPSYLQYNWNNVPSAGNYFDDNPQARATFGRFRNANEFIYLRENF